MPQKALPPQEPTTSVYRSTDTTTKIVFIRPYHFVNSVFNCGVHVNEEKVVVLKNKSYHVFPIAPGYYEITFNGKKRSSLPLDIRSGETIYVTFKMTEMASSTMYPTSSLKFTPFITEEKESLKEMEGLKKID
jgi:hypothetical protein